METLSSFDIQTAGIIVLAMMTICICILSYLSFLKKKQEKKKHDLAARLEDICAKTGYHIWLYRSEQQTITVLGQNDKPQPAMKMMDFAANYPKENFQKIVQALNNIISGEKDETEMILDPVASDSNAQKRYYKLTLSTISKKDGKPNYILAVRSDVTDKQTRQQESDSIKLRYHTIFNSNLNGISIYDKHGKLIDINPRACAALGMSLEEMQARGFTLEALLGVKDLDYENMEPLQFCAIQMDASNQPVYLEMQIKPVRNEQGVLIGFVGTGIHITDFVALYKKDVGQTNQLKQANEKIADYVENINYTLQVGGVRIIQYSPQTHTLSIYSGSNKVQYRLTQTRCMTFVDDESKKLAVKFLNSMDDLTPSPIETMIKTNIKMKEGRPLYLNLSLVPRYDKKGQVETYYGFCRDVSELKWTEEDLEIESVKAQEVETLKNTFLRNMSHEIRTPLNSVVGFAELFSSEQAGSEEEALFVKEIKANSHRLLTLVNDILLLSRLDANMIEITPKPIDFASTFDYHFQTGYGQGKDGVRCFTENHYNKLVVNIDDTQLGYVIEQITNNAINYTDKGTVSGRYDFINGRLMIAIEDTGCGIAPEKMPFVFDRFVSGDTNGSGLGLAICKEILKLMDGDINIQSEPNKGTTVWISVPCTATEIERRTTA